MNNIVFKNTTVSKQNFNNLNKLYIDIYIKEDDKEIKVGDLCFLMSLKLNILNECILENISDNQFRLFCLYLDYSNNIDMIKYISSNNILFLNDIYIYEEYRNNNIGHQVIEILSQFAKSKKIKSIYLHSCPIKRVKFNKQDKINLLNNIFESNRNKLDSFYINLGFNKLDKTNNKIELNYFYKNI